MDWFLISTDSLLRWWQSNMGGVVLMLMMLVYAVFTIRRLALRLQAHAVTRDSEINGQLDQVREALAECRRKHDDCEERGRRLEVGLAGLHGYLSALMSDQAAPQLPTLEELFSGVPPGKPAAPAMATERAAEAERSPTTHP